MKNYVKTIARKREFGIVIMVFVLATLLTCMSDAFLQWDNIKDFLRSNAVIGIMAFGMLPVLISGGIDLSVSATIALSAVVLGKFLVAFPNANPIFAFIVVIAIGGLVGIINGIIITKFKIAPIVATLGTMTIIQGFVLFYTGGFLINGLPDWFKKFGGITVGVPVQVLLFVFMGIITAFILRKTLIGRGIYAVGGSQSSAIRVGYNVDKILVFIYFYAGVLSGIAAFVHISIIGQVDPNTYTGYELDVISTVVLGGASTMGGVGSVAGTTLGVILMAILKNGLVLARIPTYWQKVVMGLVILIAVSVDVLKRKREQTRLVHVDVEEG